MTTTLVQLTYLEKDRPEVSSDLRLPDTNSPGGGTPSGSPTPSQRLRVGPRPPGTGGGQRVCNRPSDTGVISSQELSLGPEAGRNPSETVLQERG